MRRLTRSYQLPFFLCLLPYPTTIASGTQVIDICHTTFTTLMTISDLAISPSHLRSTMHCCCPAWKSTSGSCFKSLGCATVSMSSKPFPLGIWMAACKRLHYVIHVRSLDCRSLAQGIFVPKCPLVPPSLCPASACDSTSGTQLVPSVAQPKYLNPPGSRLHHCTVKYACSAKRLSKAIAACEPAEMFAARNVRRTGKLLQISIHRKLPSRSLDGTGPK